MQLAPGRYRLRAGAVDDRGRAGSVELPLLVGLRTAGALSIGVWLSVIVCGRMLGFVD